TEFWKSNERKYCDFCKCWISDNKTSVGFHENGKRHKLNVAKRITDISRKSEKDEREKQKMDAEIRKMEEAAMKSYSQDLHGRYGDMTARSINTVMNATATSSSSSRVQHGSTRQRQVDPMRWEGLASDDEEDNRRVGVDKVAADAAPQASLWVEGKSDEGHTYYWNVKTNESVWEPPKEGFLSYEEYERINQLAVNQQEIMQAEESLRCRANADEEVARYNRERHALLYRKPETAKEKKQKEEKRQEFKTEEDAATKEIGRWQAVQAKPEVAPIDWELPRTLYTEIAPVVNVPEYEPPVKRFKEKTITSLDDEPSTSSAPATFKKRKFANKGNARKALDD
ncbi:CG4291, partial [Drosophila busckii]